MKTITIKHGHSGSLTREFEDNYTFGQLKAATDIRAALGTADNVRALLDGQAMNDAAVIPPQATVRLETACNTKA